MALPKTPARLLTGNHKKSDIKVHSHLGVEGSCIKSPNTKRVISDLCLFVVKISC
jgi:hypothetical protein